MEPSAPDPSREPGLEGHLWTLWPWLQGALVPRAPARLERLRIEVEDPRLGTVALRAYLDAVEGSESAIVLVHGLGGQPLSPYVDRARRAARRRGWSSLLLGLRGADRSGEDLYHAGLTADLHAALAHPALARYRSLHLLGYSLGGHVVLRTAAEATDPRLRSVAAICAPLDLASARTWFDTRAASVYRRHVLRGLKQIALAADEHRGLGLDRAGIASARTLATFDALSVVPRFAFRDLADYDRSASVSSVLQDLRLPALLIAAERDPMVPPTAIAPFAHRGGLEVRWSARGGHVGFPPSLRVEERVLEWLAEPRGAKGAASGAGAHTRVATEGTQA